MPRATSDERRHEEVLSSHSFTRREAAADLDRIADYLFEHTPDRAESLCARCTTRQPPC